MKKRFIVEMEYEEITESLFSDVGIACTMDDQLFELKERGHIASYKYTEVTEVEPEPDEEDEEPMTPVTEIKCCECGEYKHVLNGTWALESGMCETCYCAYQGG